MIQFIQDYTTKALPPESFKKDQKVARSKESELYFVQMGIAGYVVDGKLVDQDYQPIVPTTMLVEVVSPGDRRFAHGGRGGEVIGIEAPQRASTGPGNAVVFGAGGGGMAAAATIASSGAPSSDTGLGQVEVDQLRSDLAASVEQLDDHRQATSTQIDEMTNELTAAQGAREAALADLATARSEADGHAKDLDAARTDLAAARSEADGHAKDLEAARTDLSAATDRIAQLEAELVAAKATGDDAGKPARAK